MILIDFVGFWCFLWILIIVCWFLLILIIFDGFQLMSSDFHGFRLILKDVYGFRLDFDRLVLTDLIALFIGFNWFCDLCLWFCIDCLLIFVNFEVGERLPHKGGSSGRSRRPGRPPYSQYVRYVPLNINIWLHKLTPQAIYTSRHHI